jgi:cytochrome b561
VQGVHAIIGWIIVAIAGLHAAAALFHRYVWHDSVLGRMLAGGR